MKKSVRINLLVITIVVTLFVFAGLWYLRPGVSDDILQQARSRQSQPLMEIAEPLRRPKAEDLIDTTLLIKNLKREIEPSITAAVKAELLADPSFVRSEVERIAVSSLKSELETALKSALVSDTAFAASVGRQINTESLRTQIQTAIKAGVAADLSGDSAFIRTISNKVDFSAVTRAQESAIAAVKRTNDQVIASLRAEVNAQIASIPRSTIVTTSALDSVDMDRLVAQAVDEQIPRVVESVVARIEANREQYIEMLRASLGDVVTEGEVVDLYLSYRSALVQDLVPAILGDIEAQLKGETPPSAVAIPEATRPPVAVPSETKREVATPAVVTPPTPSAPTTQIQQVQVPTPPTVVPVVSTPVPEAPSAEKMVTTSVEEAAYEAERQRLRTEAIDEVLRRIGQ